MRLRSQRVREYLLLNLILAAFACNVVPADHQNLRHSPCFPDPVPWVAPLALPTGCHRTATTALRRNPIARLQLPVRSAPLFRCLPVPVPMYCGYGYSATTLALRANPSLCRNRRLGLLDDTGGDEYTLRGISVNPRLLLYGYYWRHSSLIYWSPLRSFLAARDGRSYSRIGFREEEPCSPRVSTRRQGCMDCCCCCRSSRQSYRMIGERCRENYGDRIWEDETDCDEFDNSRSYAKWGTEIRSNDLEKVRSSRARKDGSCSVCPSCGNASKKRAGRNIHRESGRKINATVRKSRQVQKIEEAVGDDSSEQSDASDCNYNVSVSNRKETGRETNSIGFSREEKERHSTEEDKIKIRDYKRKSGNFARISVENEDFTVTSKSNDAVDSRKVDKVKHFTSLKRHGVVDKRLVEKDSKEFDNRVQGAASWSSSVRRMDEDYREKQDTERWESKEGSQNLATVSDVHEDDTMMASRYNKIADGRKVDVAESSKSMAKQHQQVDKRVVEQTKMRTDVRGEYAHHEDQVTDQSQSREGSERFIGISEAHEDYDENISKRDNILNARKENKEQSSLSTLIENTTIDHQLIGSKVTRELIENHRQLEEVHSSNMQRTLNEARHHEEMIVKNRDDKSISVHRARDKRGQADQQVLNKKDVGELHEKRVSGFHSRENEKVNSSQSHLQCRIDDLVDYSSSTMNLVHQAGNLQNQSERQRQSTKHSSLQGESGRSSRVSELLRKDTGRLSSAQVIYSSNIKDELDDHQHDSKIESLKDSRISKYSSIDIQKDSSLPELSDLRIGNHIENTSLLLVQDEKKKRGILIGETSRPTNQETTFTGMLDDDSSLLDTNKQQLDGWTQRPEAHMDKGGALNSASRLESCSAIYVGEFMDKLRQETSSFKISSGTQTEEMQSRSTLIKSSSLGTRTKDKDDKSAQVSSRRSPSGSGTKGPSDEIWDVKSSISQEDEKKDKSGEDGCRAGIVDSKIVTPAKENTIGRRNAKSLWAHVADILRMGWVHHSNTSSQKSGKRSSSEGSEGWFSGQDASDNENDMIRSSNLKELLHVGGSIDQDLETHSSITPGSLLEAPGIATMESGSGASTSIEILGGNVYKGAYLGTSLEDMDLAKNEKESKDITSGTISFDLPKQPLTGDASSVTIDENTGNLAGSVSGYIEDLKIEEPSEVDKTEGKDGEIKRRKLQRNKQVLKETFEEWEDAYRLESEQRKIDEFFMREALVEAQNAADIWEVPVGAVLVHNGKIIARGFNLVEEKRDSTAHAEMICIREASNLLRTWRLAETTLYVTLEPCPMCAGAILQARIDTVVWGAPNKLLGADGSWVRLFPGDGGNNSLDASSQVAGPVHPFHPKIQIRRGVLATECSDVLQQFFQLRRKKNEKQEPPPPACLPVPNHPIKLFRKMHNIFSIFC